MDPPERSACRPLDAAALARVQRRLESAAAPPWLHGEVARRMAERLPLIRLQPRRILDWSSFLGASGACLAQAYPRARRLALEANLARRDATAAALRRPWWSARLWGGAADAVGLASEVAPAAADLLWSNMALHGSADPQATMQQWQRALAVDGFLMFSTLGPGTLRTLAALYDAQGWGAPFAPFVDMHDLGDMLLQAGFSDPVMDQEPLVLSWRGGEAALAELRQLGGNVAQVRPPGLRTPRWRARLARLLEAQSGAEGRVSLSFEIVYGHAVKLAPRPRVAAETVLAVEDLRAMARAGRRPG